MSQNPIQEGAAEGSQFSKGDEVEVSFEKDDIWFPATVLEYLSENNYVVKYWFRKESGEALLQNSTVSLSRIRPTPPLHKTRRGYALYDKVDAFCDFAWTTGYIIKEFGDRKFMVYFKGTHNKMVFSETKLRTHMDWVDGRWVDMFQPKGADNDTSQSRPSKNSGIENAAEITNSTTCETVALESETPSKQNSSQESKTPTSNTCQTNGSSSKRRRNVSSLKSESRSVDDKVTKVAKNDASHSSSSKKSKTETADVITTSTGFKTDATKRKIASNQNSSQEPRTPTSTVCQTDEASKRSRDVLSLKPKTNSLDDKATEGKKVSGLDNNTIPPLRRGRPPKTLLSSTKGNESNAGARTAEGTNHEECKTELNLELAIKQPEISDISGSNSRPSKKSKIENASAITASTCCKTDATKAKAPIGQNSPEEPKTPTASVCQAGEAGLERPSDASPLKPDSCSPDDQVTTGRNAGHLKNCTTESVKRKGRPPKTPHSATGANTSIEGVKTAEGTDEEVCETEHVLASAQNETKSSQDNIPSQSHIKGSRTSIGDQKGHGHNPAGLIFKKGTEGTQFSNGDEVEVSFERDDSYDIWFPATVVKYLSENKYLVKYWSRKESGDALLQNSTVVLQRIRPIPPLHKRRRGYVLYDKVDAFYDCAWTSGLIIKEFDDKNFMVSFKRTNNTMVFSETKLRTHMDWVDGKWINESQSEGADNDASQSRPSKESESENAAEITNSTSCETDKMDMKAPSKQKSFQEPKTPTSSMCQTDASPARRRKNVSSLKTGSRSVDQKVPKVAKNDASHSNPSKISKTEKAEVIRMSTGCKTDATKTELSKKSSPEPKTLTSTVCQNDAASQEPSNASSLKPKTRSLDDKVVESKKVSELDNNAIQSLSRRGRPHKTPQSSAKGNESNAGARTAEGTNDKECKSELVLALEYTGLAKKQPEISDNGGSHSRPSKKSKIENVPAITASASCKTDATKAKVPIGQNSSEEPKTPTFTVCQTGGEALERPSDASSLKTDNCSPDYKVTKGRKVGQLKICTTESLKRRGRPHKTPQSATEGNKSIKGAKTADGTDEKVCETEDVLASAQNETKTPHYNTPRQSHMEGSQTSTGDKKGQGHNPAGLILEEIPKNSQREQTERSLELSGTQSKEEIATKSSEKTEKAVPSDELKKPPSKKRGETDVDPSAKSLHLAIYDNEKSSQEKIGKTSVDSSTISHHSAVDGVSREETEVGVVAIDGNPGIGTDLNQMFPFEKTVPLWDCIESMEIFQSKPQKPHFRSLESSDEDYREGLAICQMVTFLKITKKIPELQLNMPRSSMKNSLENLVGLEDNGFDVESVRNRLNDLLVKKDKHDLLQNDMKETETQIMECKTKKAKIDEALDEIDKKLNELRAKREAAVLNKELKDAVIAVSQSSLDYTTNQMKIIQSDFENLATACW